MKKNLTKELKEGLKNSTAERIVQSIYTSTVQQALPNITVTTFVNSDTIFQKDQIHVLTEFKHDLNLDDPIDRSKPIVQTLGYLKKIQEKEAEVPKIVFIACKSGCFNVATEKLIKYLSYEGVDWSIASGSLPVKYPELVKAVSEDTEVQPSWIYKVEDKGFSIEDIIEEWGRICTGKYVVNPITEKNILKKYKYWNEKVLMAPRQPESEWIVYLEDGNSAKSPDLFFSFLTNPIKCYCSPKEEDVLYIGGKFVKGNFQAFKKLEEEIEKIDSRELDRIVANKDRLLEEIYRRYTGAFFTPKIWVDEAHKMITECLGENWKDEWVVWDCAAGTANLTRDYKFRDLYISTLEQGDIDDIKASGYNKEAKDIFQYNFLSECPIKDSILEEDKTGLSSKVPYQLRDAFKEGKKIFFLINPPYGTAGTLRKEGKKGVSISTVNLVMKQNKVGGCSAQIYAQFLYKILCLKQIYSHSRIAIGLFAPPKYMISPSFSKLRKILKNELNYKSGFLFPAKQFSEVTSNWGVSFTIWDGKEHFTTTSKEKLILKESPNLYIGEKQICSIEKHEWNNFLRDVEKVRKDVLPLKSALNVCNRPSSQNKLGSVLINSLGSFCTMGYYIVGASGISEFILSTSGCPGGGSKNITPVNLRKIISFFTALKTTKSNWINYNDIFEVPNVSHPDYNQWNNDAIIYSLFSQQSSLRQVPYKEKLWDVKNEFFFLPNSEMKELAEKYGFRDMIQDARDEKNRYVYLLLQDTPLSPDAKAVLEAAQDLIRTSMATRETYHKAHPERHLQAWDAGWAQLKPLFKEQYPKQYNIFKERFKKFEDRMREGVYKFGFLRR